MIKKTNFNSKKCIEKKGILVASFGTSHEDTRKVTIEACENKISEVFPEYEVRRAFTSNIVRKILKEKNNMDIDDVEGALIKMKNDGFSEIVVQSLHVIPGEEYQEKILKITDKFKNSFKKIDVGRPILNDIADYEIAAKALKEQIQELKKEQAVILMGHGTHHPANACYSCLQTILDEQIQNIYIGTVEGYPELDDIIPKLKAKNIKEVTLMPYMIVAGDHAKNDMAGDEDDSWKTILEKEGFKVCCHLHGLGENSAYQNIFVEHLRDAIKK